MFKYRRWGKSVCLYTIYFAQVEVIILVAQPYVLGLNLAEIYVTREM